MSDIFKMNSRDIGLTLLVQKHVAFPCSSLHASSIIQVLSDKHFLWASVVLQAFLALKGGIVSKVLQKDFICSLLLLSSLLL